MAGMRSNESREEENEGTTKGHQTLGEACIRSGGSTSRETIFDRPEAISLGRTGGLVRTQGCV